jgi:hypothetical protein
MKENFYTIDGYYDNYDWMDNATYSENFLGIIEGERIYVGDSCLLPGIFPNEEDVILYLFKI